MTKVTNNEKTHTTPKVKQTMLEETKYMTTNKNEVKQVPVL